MAQKIQDVLTHLEHGRPLLLVSQALKSAQHSGCIAIFGAVVEDRRTHVLVRT